jgi:hypothetical protein
MLKIMEGVIFPSATSSSVDGATDFHGPFRQYGRTPRRLNGRRDRCCNLVGSWFPEELWPGAGGCTRCSTTLDHAATIRKFQMVQPGTVLKGT